MPDRKYGQFPFLICGFKLHSVNCKQTLQLRTQLNICSHVLALDRKEFPPNHHWVNYEKRTLHKDILVFYRTTL